MDRVQSGGYSALIEAAYRLIPAGMHHLLQPDFLTGVDPVFAGLHHYRQTVDGRAYGSTAHAVYEFHQLHMPRSCRCPTVVLPKLEPLEIVVHELGHILHHRLSFEPQPLPVTDYAGRDRYEAFAEAFAGWVMPFGHGYGAAKDLLYERDRSTVALFEQIADEERRSA